MSVTRNPDHAPYLPLAGGELTGGLRVPYLMSAPAAGEHSAVRVYILPNVKTESHVSSLTYKEMLGYLLRWICQTYPGLSMPMFVGNIWPGRVGCGLIYIGDTSDVMSDGLPRYSGGMWTTYGIQMIYFGTNDGVLSVKSVSGTDVDKMGDTPVPGPEMFAAGGVIYLDRLTLRERGWAA